VPRRASGSSRSRVNDGGGLQYVSRKIDRALGFSRRGEYIGERAVSGGGLGGLTPWWRGPGLGRDGAVMMMLESLIAFVDEVK
jgi:hypothetical protein